MGIILNKLNEKIDSIMRSFETNKRLQHQGLKGSFNENEINGLLNDVIPSKFKLKRGLIENSFGHQSNETDIVIYDDEILPPYIKGDLSVIPVEAVVYAIEIKSYLTKKELRTTIDKFDNFHAIGGRSPTVLFAYSSDIKGSELERYRKCDKRFYTSPSISVICTANKSYYFKSSECFYLKDLYSNQNWLSKITKSKGFDLEEIIDEAKKRLMNDDYLDKLTRLKFAQAIIDVITLERNAGQVRDPKTITLNELKLDEVKYTVHKWIGIESNELSNNAVLSFLAGLSNTVSKGKFGKYIFGNTGINLKVFSICFEDMWGNISGNQYNENGIEHDVNDYTFNLKSSNGLNKLVFALKK